MQNQKSPISARYAKIHYQYQHTMQKMHINDVTMEMYIRTNKSVLQYFVFIDNGSISHCISAQVASQLVSKQREVTQVRSIKFKASVS
jgi:hypothetical protein